MKELGGKLIAWSQVLAMWSASHSGTGKWNENKSASTSTEYPTHLHLLDLREKTLVNISSSYLLRRKNRRLSCQSKFALIPGLGVFKVVLEYHDGILELG